MANVENKKEQVVREEEANSMIKNAEKFLVARAKQKSNKGPRQNRSFLYM